MKRWKYLYEDWPISDVREDTEQIYVSAMHRPQSDCIIDYNAKSNVGRVLIYSDEEIDGTDIVLLATNVEAYSW